MPSMQLIWLPVVILVSLATPDFGDCPSKLSPKLCPVFEAAADMEYVQVRIVLDPKVESSFVWDKSKPGTPRPLLADSKDLIAKYDLRELGLPESVYVPLYSPQDFSPSIDEVMYHNASVTKANVGKLISETYVASVEPGCGSSIRTSLCTDINTRPDSAPIHISIGLKGALQTDSAARRAYLSKYDIRDTASTSPCFASGYAATPVSIRALGMDPEVNYIENGSEGCPSHVNPRSPTNTLRSVGFPPGSFRNHRLDGRALPAP